MSRDGHVIKGAHGEVRIEADALAALVIAAAERVDGARARRPRRGLDVSVADGKVEVELELAAQYGAVLPELARAVQDGRLEPEDVTAESLARFLDAPDIPDPDLIIRTSGEQRLSNFLMWQAAYSELVFVPIHWPDFDKAALESAIAEYARRERRFGGLAAKTGS